jgi:hypothetical protein
MVRRKGPPRFVTPKEMRGKTESNPNAPAAVDETPTPGVDQTPKRLMVPSVSSHAPLGEDRSNYPGDHQPIEIPTS